MRRPDGFFSPFLPAGRRRTTLRRGYTLVEILTATVLMIIIMLAVTVIFASVTDSIAQSRATLEMSQRLRSVTALLKQDLENATACMAPPLHPRDNSGYFQYVEGPIGPVVSPGEMAWNSDLDGQVNSAGSPVDFDTTVGDIDDIVMFTATTKGEPYVGLVNGVPTVSNTAEIIWFIRGHTLYRRVLLVKPEIDVRSEPRNGFYARNDLSVRKTWDNQTVPPSPPAPSPPPPGVQHRPVLIANSLADLTRPECRFAHHPDLRAWDWPRILGDASSGPRSTPIPADVATTYLQRAASVRYWNEGKPFPFFLRPWLGSPYPLTVDADSKWVPGLGLPILAECSASNWYAGDALPSDRPYPLPGGNWNTTGLRAPLCNPMVDPAGYYDAWVNEHPWTNIDPATGAMQAYQGTRVGEDVVMTNVIGFDVKAWDPRAPVLTQGSVALLPGDPGYIAAVNAFRATIRANAGDAPYMPLLGAYADLNYMARVPFNSSYYPDTTATMPSGEPGVDDFVIPVPLLYRHGQTDSLAYGTLSAFAVNRQPYEFFPAVYDTWSLHYEYNRHWVNYVSDNPSDANRINPLPDPAGYVGDEDGDGDFDEGTNGFDNDGQNGVDDVFERETKPPYAVPLQGIQVRIRTFEPGSRQVREVTIVQNFRTK